MTRTRIMYNFRTPLGTFGSSGLAAAAHSCDRTTIINRCARDPENYQKIPKPPREVRVRTVRGPVSEGPQVPTWPLSWSSYRFLSDPVKEQIYNRWCKKNNHNPDSAQGADAFFDAMDLYSNTAEADAELDQTLEASAE